MQAIGFAACYGSWCHGSIFLSPTGTRVLSQCLCGLLHKWSRAEMSDWEISSFLYTETARDSVQYHARCLVFQVGWVISLIREWGEVKVITWFIGEIRDVYVCSQSLSFFHSFCVLMFTYLLLVPDCVSLGCCSHNLLLVHFLKSDYFSLSFLLLTRGG